MEDKIIREEYMSNEPKLGYQCPVCGKYFNDSHYSRPIRQFDSLYCPHKCSKCQHACGTWMKIIDVEKKIVCRYVNLNPKK